jgi:transcriptional antiterminator Rof (Rho-off)
MSCTCMCGANLYNIMLRQELNKKKNVKPESEQAKTNENSHEYLLVKSMRKVWKYPTDTIRSPD